MKFIILNSKNLSLSKIKSINSNYAFNSYSMANVINSDSINDIRIAIDRVKCSDDHLNERIALIANNNIVIDQFCITDKYCKTIGALFCIGKELYNDNIENLFNAITLSVSEYYRDLMLNIMMAINSNKSDFVNSSKIFDIGIYTEDIEKQTADRAKDILLFNKEKE